MIGMQLAAPPYTRATRLTLTPGTRLGPYEVLAPIGEGGMGESLPRPRHQARSRRRAQILSGVFAPTRTGSRVSAGGAGPRLAQPSEHRRNLRLRRQRGDARAGAGARRRSDAGDRIAEGPIPLADALPIARQIADALEAAHEQGIVHRDLKPANIKVRDDGTVKVLDFGLAKGDGARGGWSSDAASQSPTLTSPAMTQMGMILGTAAYMAPEQARGKAVDKRADIWAFGVVLYEMLTGRARVRRRDVSDTLAAVLKRRARLDALPADDAARDPAAARALPREGSEEPPARHRRCADRVARSRRAGGSATGPRPRRAAPLWRRALPWAVAAAAGVALAAVAGRRVAREPAGPPLRRFTLALPSKSAPNWNDFGVAISPDGAQLAYNCRDGNTSASVCGPRQPERASRRRWPRCDRLVLLAGRRVDRVRR